MCGEPLRWRKHYDTSNDERCVSLEMSDNLLPSPAMFPKMRMPSLRCYAFCRLKSAVSFESPGRMLRGRMRSI